MKKLTEVDWSRAPEGATHYNTACSYPWLRDVPASFYVDECWVEYTSDSAYWEVDFSKAIKRPQEWDDSGVPPIGTVCEYLWSEGKEWRKCEVVAYYYANVVVVDVLDNTADLVQPTMIRPFKTSEQIAVEERQQAINEMYMVFVTKGRAMHGDLGVLYDAGYRKTEVNND